MTRFLGGALGHYTVFPGLTDQRLLLFDSSGLRWIETAALASASDPPGDTPSSPTASHPLWMTGDARHFEASTVTDFAAMMDRVVARKTREHLATFLASYAHIEFGEPRSLIPEEIALVLTAFDIFLLEDSLASLFVPELDELCGRLSKHAGQEALFPTVEGCRMRNACFDALACLKTLEARVSNLLDQHAVRRERLCALTPANDP